MSEPIIINASPSNAYPSLHGVVTPDLIQEVRTGKYSASYINWSRTMQLLRIHAPNWLPFCVPAPDGGIVHRAPDGGYLLIGFRHSNGHETPVVPQAVMNNSNNSIAFEEITSRDITDTHRRGICLACALLFGLGYELWAKVEIEDPYTRKSQQDEAEELLQSLKHCKTADEARSLYKKASKAVKEKILDEFKEYVAKIESNSNSNSEESK